MGKGLVSVIVPVYNAEKSLGKCIDSILSQTYKNIEVLLIDDGSTDNSFDLCNRYEHKDKRVKTFRQNNQGPGAARNYGINISSGEYIQFVDSDDFISPEMIDELVLCLERNNLDLVICGYRMVDDLGKEIRAVSERSGNYSGRDFLKIASKWAENPLMGSPWNKIYKKEMLNLHDIKFPIGKRWAEDYEFNLKIYQHCKEIGIVDKCLYSYRISNSEMSSFNNKGEKIDYRRSIEDIYSVTSEYNRLVSIIDSEDCEIQHVYENLFLRMLYVAGLKFERKEFVQELKDEKIIGFYKRYIKKSVSQRMAAKFIFWLYKNGKYESLYFLYWSKRKLKNSVSVLKQIKIK